MANSLTTNKWCKWSLMSSFINYGYFMSRYFILFFWFWVKNCIRLKTNFVRTKIMFCVFKKYFCTSKNIFAHLKSILLLFAHLKSILLFFANQIKYLLLYILYFTFKFSFVHPKSKFIGPKTGYAYP